MNKIISIFLLLLCALANAQISDSMFYKANFLGIPDHPCLLKTVVAEDDSYALWDLTYNRLNFELNPEILFIKGSVYFEFISKTNQLQSIKIDLANNMVIHKISSGNDQLSFSREGDQVNILLSEALSINKTENFTVEFEGEPIGSGYESFAQSFHGDSIPALATLSEPYGAKDWWPCKQSLSDKIDSLDVIVKSPSDYTTASNGLLVENVIAKGIRTIHWKHRHPIATYLVFVSTTEYTIYSDWATLSNGQQVEILNYVYPSSYDKAKANTPITADLIELYSKLFIDYPFKNEKYGHAQFPWGGGMEHQTMSSMGYFNAPLIAHELAHQWFGDYITCGSWHEIWLNEGFATYLTGLYYQNLEPTQWENWKKSVINAILSEAGGSIYVDDTNDFRRIFSSRLSYKKGAFVLHMLRGQLGDSTFFQGVKNYLNDDRVTHGFATTDILRENIEAAGDTSLTEFFNDWILGEGYPVYNIDCSTENQQLTINIKQTPSVNNGPFFEMNIPISLYHNGDRQDIWVPNHTANDHLEYALAYQPDSVSINKDLWLLGKFSNSVNNVPYNSEGNLSIYVDQERKILYLNLPNNSEGNFSIYRLNGKMTETGISISQKGEFSLVNFQKGFYLLQFRGKGQVLSAKFVVQ